MRILMITQWFDPEPTFKGLLFARELQRLGHEVEVLTASCLFVFFVDRTSPCRAGMPGLPTANG